MSEIFSAALGRRLSYCAGLFLAALLCTPAVAQQDAETLPPADSLEQRSDTSVVDSSVVDQPRPPELPSIGEDTLRSVARALIAVDSVRREFHGRQGITADSTRRSGNLHLQFESAVTRTIEGEGVSVETYVRVVRAARTDPDLRRRLRGFVAEFREP